MKNLLIMKYDSFAVSIISIIYGINLFIFPEIINGGIIYNVLSGILNSFTIGSLLIIFGTLKLIGIFANLPKLRAFSISVLVSIWTLFLVTVLFSGVVNSIWIFGLAMVTFTFGVVVKEWFY